MPNDNKFDQKQPQGAKPQNKPDAKRDMENREPQRAADGEFDLGQQNVGQQHQQQREPKEGQEQRQPQSQRGLDGDAEETGNQTNRTRPQQPSPGPQRK